MVASRLVFRNEPARPLLGQAHEAGDRHFAGRQPLRARRGLLAIDRNKAAIDKHDRVARGLERRDHLPARRAAFDGVQMQLPVVMETAANRNPQVFDLGFRGPQLFSSGWLRVLDCTPTSARDMAVEAKRIGLIDLRVSGEIVDLVLDRLDPLAKRS